MEFCCGTIAEMTEGNIIETIDTHSKNNRISYVHLRNVRGKAPFYEETFIDDGEIDVSLVLKTLHRNGFQGVIIPDHAPQMTCEAPWYAGMAYAMGYLKAKIEDATR